MTVELDTAICEEFRYTADPNLAAQRAEVRLRADPGRYRRSRLARGLSPMVAPLRGDERVSVGEFRRLYRTGAIQVLDVRHPSELGGPLLPVPGSVHVPIDRLEEELPYVDLDPNRVVFVVCKKGLRSACAMERLKRLGYDRVVSLDGGLRALLEG